LLYPQIVPFREKVNLLGRGVVFADAITTLSEQYAREILTHEYGEKLEPILNERKDSLYGILNGIDVDLYNPATDHQIERQFDADRLEERKANKAALQREVGLPERNDVPLLGIISRMIEPKGYDVLLPAMAQLLERNDAQFVLLAVGEPEYERQAEELAARFPDKMKAFIAFEPRLAQRIYAGIDMFLAPSRFEAGGQGQMIAMRYGAVPVVRHTGGLADTVQDYKPGQGGNGFVFGPYTSYAFYRALARALDAYRDHESWQSLMRHDMSQDFSWDRSARSYEDVYRRAVAARRGG
jgi:starch synthase